MKSSRSPPLPPRPPPPPPARARLDLRWITLVARLGNVIEQQSDDERMHDDRYDGPPTLSFAALGHARGRQAPAADGAGGGAGGGRGGGGAGAGQRGRVGSCGWIPQLIRPGAPKGFSRRMGSDSRRSLTPLLRPTP